MHQQGGCQNQATQHQLQSQQGQHAGKQPVGRPIQPGHQPQLRAALQVVLQGQRVQAQTGQVEQQREQLGHDGRHTAGQARQVGPVHLEHVGVHTGPPHGTDRDRCGAGRRGGLPLSNALGLGQQIVGEAHADVGLVLWLAVGLPVGLFRGWCAGLIRRLRGQSGAVAVLRRARRGAQRGVQKVAAPGLPHRLPAALRPSGGLPAAKGQGGVQWRHGQQELVCLNLPLAGCGQLRGHRLTGFARALVRDAVHGHHRHAVGHQGDRFGHSFWVQFHGGPVVKRAPD